MRILIVDDEAGVRSSLTTMLKESHEIRSCANGAEALKELSESQFDLVLTDQLMPGVSGVEFIAKAVAVSPKTAFVLMAGVDSLEQAVEALRQGAEDYVVKPVEYVELKHRIKRIEELRAARAAQASRPRVVAAVPSVPAPSSQKTSNVISISSAAGNGSQLGQRGLNEIVEELESRLVLEAMGRTGNNQIRAAELLQITRGALQYKLKKYVKPLAA